MKLKHEYVITWAARLPKDGPDRYYDSLPNNLTKVDNSLVVPGLIDRLLDEGASEIRIYHYLTNDESLTQAMTDREEVIPF